MTLRGSLTSLLLCLLTVPSLLAQETKPTSTNTNALQQQIARLETQLAALMEQNAALQKESKGIKTPSPSGITPAEVRILPLRHTDAIEATQTLRELFEGVEEAKLRIVYHRSTNSIIARGNTGDLETIEAVLHRLEDISQEKAKSKTDNNPTPMPLQKRIEELRNQLSMAQTEVEQWKERVAWLEIMVKKGYVSATQAQVDRSRLASSEAALAKIRKQLESLPSDTKKGVEKEKKSQK